MFVQLLVLFVFVFTNFCTFLKTQDTNSKAEAMEGFLQGQHWSQTVSIPIAQQGKPQTWCHGMWLQQGARRGIFLWHEDRTDPLAKIKTAKALAQVDFVLTQEGTTHQVRPTSVPCFWTTRIRQTKSLLQSHALNSAVHAVG